MDNNGAGLADCLGEFFQTHITRGAHGQFFTPPHVTDMMAQMTVGEEAKEKTIMDPACGSGRMLLSAAKVSRRNYFFGADLDNRCCKMTAINLCLNGLIGQVAWMNSLTLEHWGGYEIFYDEKRMYVPTIKKLNAGTEKEMMATNIFQRRCTVGILKEMKRAFYLLRLELLKCQRRRGSFYNVARVYKIKPPTLRTVHGNLRLKRTKRVAPIILFLNNFSPKLIVYMGYGVNVFLICSGEARKGIKTGFYMS